MLSLIGKHPPMPAEFLAKAAAATAQIAAKVAAQSKKEQGILRQEDFDPLWQDYITLFLAAQHDKCGYCDDSHPRKYINDIEHYRPKSKVTDGAKVSAGYWWLAYEWSNYLYACAWCNRTHKRNHFPVRGRRAKKPGEEASERPLVLNPFVVDPAPHFRFEPDGQLASDTLEGKYSIEVLGLRRQDLVSRRQTVGLRVERHINDYVDSLELNDQVGKLRALRELYFAGKDSSAFASLAKYLIRRELRLTHEDLSALAAQQGWV